MFGPETFLLRDADVVVCDTGHDGARAEIESLFEPGQAVKTKLLADDAEKALFEALGRASETVRPMLDERRYADALRSLASLKAPVDRFFDDVLVMTDDEALKSNRLALLGELRDLFLDVADISRLSIA